MSTTETLTTTTAVPTTVAALPSTSTQPYLNQGQSSCATAQSPCAHVAANISVPSGHHCQVVPCSQHQQLITTHQQQPITHQVQAATQTLQTSVTNETKKPSKTTITQDGVKKKGSRVLFSSRHPNQNQQGVSFPQNQSSNYQIDPNSGTLFYLVCSFLSNFDLLIY